MTANSSKLNAIFISLMGLTLFSSSFLLFTIQPLVGKIILPYFGGTAGVWSICLLFFQSVLLLGYLYSHLLLKIIAIKNQLIIHGALVLCSLYYLPLNFKDLATVNAGANPPWIIFKLLTSIAVPFIVLTANTSIFQNIHSKINSNKNPYVFYAVSNIGCLIGLLTYVLITSPNLDIDAQKSYWSLGYWVITFLILTSLLDVKFLIKPEIVLPANPSKTITSNTTKIRWLVEAGVPTALLCAITAYLSSHIASTPLLWILPLSIYLISIAIPFGPEKLASKFSIITKNWPKLAMLGVILYITGPQTIPALVFTILLITFFGVCLGLHTQVYRSRPEPQKLSEFYLFFALGGVLGSIFSSILAPMLFTSYFEFPILLVLARVCFRTIGSSGTTKAGLNLKTELISLIGIYFFTYIWFSSQLINGLPEIVLFGSPILVILLLKKPKRIALGLVVALLAFTHLQWNKTILFQGRSFYSPLIVKKTQNGKFHELVNGSIVHGRQAVEMKSAGIPLSYYDPNGGAGLLFKEHGEEWTDIAGIGLGIGALSGYLTSSQRMDFFEIDPLVIKIAETPKYFSFVTDARQRGAEVSLIEGDARITLEKSLKKYDVIFVDAFQSSAIPTHLLTQEAFEIYRSKLKKNGMIVFHISNHFMDFESLIATQAESINFSGLHYKYQGNETGGDPSIWAAIFEDTKSGTDSKFTNWESLSKNKVVSKWTDAHTNLLEL
jgi:hypothetical protein